jgi:hypothetical protein
MTDTQNPFDLAALRADLAEAQSALTAFADGPARRAADDTARAFEQAGARIARGLTAAARDGEITFREMAKVILEALARVALDRIFSSQGGGGLSLPFFGARAAGGAVNRGGAYLVGERGPELFVPGSSGAVEPAAGAGITIHMHFAAGSDADGIARHRGQIAAEIARAAAYGRRNL